MSRPLFHTANSATGILPETFDKMELPRSVRKIYHEGDYPLAVPILVLVGIIVSVGFGIWKFSAVTILKDLVFDKTGIFILSFIILLCIFLIIIIAYLLQEIHKAIQFRKGNYQMAVSCLTNIQYVRTESSYRDKYHRTHTTEGYDIYYYFGSVKTKFDSSFFATDGKEGDMYLLFVMNHKLVAYMNIESILDGSYEAEKKYLREQYKKQDPEAEFIEETEHYPEYSENGSEIFQEHLIKAEEIYAKKKDISEKRKDYLYRKLNEWKLQNADNDSLFGRIANQYIDDIIENHNNEKEKKD